MGPFTVWVQKKCDAAMAKDDGADDELMRNYTAI